LLLNDLSEFRVTRSTTSVPTLNQLIRMFTTGTQSNIFMRSTDGTDNATIQLICDTNHALSQLELSAFGSTVIDIDCDTRVRFGTTVSTGSAKIRIMGNSNGHYVEFKVSDTIGADASYQWPHTYSNGQVLTVDGSGVMSWATFVSNATHTGEVTGSGALTLDKTAITNRSTVTPTRSDVALLSDQSNSDALIKNNLGAILNLNDEYHLRAMAALGSTIKMFPIGTGPGMMTLTAALADGTTRWAAYYLHRPQTITGVKFYQTTQGNYIDDQYNGVALYSVSGGTWTKVAETTNDGTFWEGTANTWHTKAFATPYDAAEGVYYIAALYCNNGSQVTAPAILGMTSLQGNNNGLMDFTNSNKLRGQRTAQTTLPASETSTNVTSISTCLAILPY